MVWKRACGAIVDRLSGEGSYTGSSNTKPTITMNLCSVLSWKLHKRSFRRFAAQMKARNLRDLAKRVAAADAEPLRQALRYISRNTTLPPRARAQAQLQLGNMPSNTRINQVKNRCVETARGRGVFRDFRICRVSSNEVRTEDLR